MLKQFYEEWLSVRERNMKLLLETYIAIKVRVTRIIAMETVMCIMHCRKYHLHNCNRDSHLHNYNENCHPHICCRNCYLHMCCRNFYLHNCYRNSHLYNCNRRIHQHTSNRKYHLKTCKNATDVVTCITAIESVSCIVLTETVTYRIDYRNFHLQKWCQSETLLVTTKKLSKRVSTNFKANSFSIPCIT